MRYFGVDVHLEFCEVAVAEGGKVSQVGRIASTPEAIREFARVSAARIRSFWMPAVA